MDKNYTKAKQFTNSVVKIYLTMAALEKDGKTESEAYKNLAYILPKAIAIENENYLVVDSLNKYIHANYSVIDSCKTGGGYFTLPTLETLSSIRVLNTLDKSKLYTLDGILFRNPIVYRLQSYLDETFFFEIAEYLKKARKEEREHLIDFKYALLATSITLEYEDVVLPKSNDSLSKEEMKMSMTYLFPKVQELVDKLFAMHDEDIDSETILQVLYTKACIRLLPPIYEGVILNELSNSVGLKRLEGAVTGVEVKRLCDMLTYFNEASISSRSI